MKFNISYQLVIAGLTVLGILPLMLVAHFADAQEGEQSMKAAAQQFLQGLSENQQSAAQFSMDDAERMSWHYFPKSREGVPLSEMTDAQVKQAYALMRSGLSPVGYEKASGIIELEGILGQLEGREAYRDPERYFWTLFGELSGKAPWGWRVEGHHLSLNYTLVPDEQTAMTPAFFGTDPATVPRGERKGWTVLDKEESLARAFIKSLQRNQQRKAIVDERAPADILTRARRQISLDAPTGIAFSDLSQEQQSTFLDLLNVYLGKFRKDIAKFRMDEIREAGLDQLHFAWAGGLNKGEGHYYRIQGPSLLIEYDNTQDGANHIHTVIRDPQNEFGKDLLQDHYETSDAGHGHTHGGSQHVTHVNQHNHIH